MNEVVQIADADIPQTSVTVENNSEGRRSSSSSHSCTLLALAIGYTQQTSSPSPAVTSSSPHPPAVTTAPPSPPSPPVTGLTGLSNPGMLRAPARLLQNVHRVSAGSAGSPGSDRPPEPLTDAHHTPHKPTSMFRSIFFALFICGSVSLVAAAMAAAAMRSSKEETIVLCTPGISLLTATFLLALYACSREMCCRGGGGGTSGARVGAAHGMGARQASWLFTVEQVFRDHTRRLIQNLSATDRERFGLPPTYESSRSDPVCPDSPDHRGRRTCVITVTGSAPPGYEDSCGGYDNPGLVVVGHDELHRGGAGHSNTWTIGGDPVITRLTHQDTRGRGSLPPKYDDIGL